MQTLWFYISSMPNWSSMSIFTFSAGCTFIYMHVFLSYVTSIFKKTEICSWVSVILTYWKWFLIANIGFYVYTILLWTLRPTLNWCNSYCPNKMLSDKFCFTVKTFWHFFSSSWKLWSEIYRSSMVSLMNWI
jgi:hypothetical protein